MTTDEMRSGFDSLQNVKARERQLVLLGALLASKELRQSIQRIEGWDHRLNAAINDLFDASSLAKNKNSLALVLEDLGVSEWGSDLGNPLRLIVEHVRLDGEIGSELAAVAHESMRLFRARHGTASDKREAVERMKNLLKELQ